MMVQSAGTEFVFPAVPMVPPPPPPEPPSSAPVSRYRSLRGKSVSSPRPPRAFDVFQDPDTYARAGGSSTDLPQQGLSTATIASRRRSKSVTVAPTRLGFAGLGLSPSATGGLAPKAAVGAVGNATRQLPARHAAAAHLAPVIIAPDGAEVPDPEDFGPPSPAPTLPAALTPKPLNVPSILRRVKSDDAVKSRLLPTDIARLKSLNDLAFRSNNQTADRVAQLEREERQRRLQEEREALRWADEVARLEAETDRILAEQRKRDAVRARSQATPPPKPRYLILEKFTFLSRSRRSNATNSQPGTPSPTAPTVFSLDFSRTSSIESPLSPSLERMSFIEQGGKGIVPQTDAPTSAINGGERRVTVRCLSSTISLPVTADTTPVDILYSSANLITHRIEPEESIIIECYVELGLERRLRRYERIRDVMNSWDRDQQNSLLILTYDISENYSELDISSVPRTDLPPRGFSLYLYHSSRPGKWNKRYITLLETGQMFSSKKPDAKPSDKDSTVLCHLSDFDIYTPRESEVRRHLKAPKRFCYAVKSQQKTFLFPNGENFVHFFCTEDREMAHRFQELIHGWRSWYLVNKKVDFTPKEPPPQISKRSGTVKHGITKSKSVVQSGAHRLQVSVDQTPYTIGAFQPLLDLDRFNKPLDDFGKDFLADPKPEQPKEAAKPKALTKAHGQTPSTPQSLRSDGEFSPGGLLGSGYEEKRKLAERTERPDSDRSSGPFTEGPSLLNGGVTSPTSPQDKPEPRSWFPSAAEHTARERSRSVRAPRRPVTADSNGSRNNKMPQPLVNFNNSQEPSRPRQGGHGVKAPGGGPLINFATGGQNPNMNMLHRSNTRTGPPLSNSQSGFSNANPGHRPRSRSTVGLQPMGRRHDEMPPVPPLPHRSMRREGPPPREAPRGRDPRPREPLINRAGTTNNLRF